MSIYGNVVGGSGGFGKTFILEDEAGTQFMAVCVGEETVFTATDNDVREGLVYASDKGVSTGTKIIPVYYARYGEKIILANREATITTPEYDYDSLMVIVSTYNISSSQSVSSTYLSVYDAMYMVGGNTKVSDITIDAENEQINLGITVSEKSVLRYFVIKEEY